MRTDFRLEVYRGFRVRPARGKHLSWFLFWGDFQIYTPCLVHTSKISSTLPYPWSTIKTRSTYRYFLSIDRSGPKSGPTAQCTPSSNNWVCFYFRCDRATNNWAFSMTGGFASDLYIYLFYLIFVADLSSIMIWIDYMRDLNQPQSL